MEIKRFTYLLTLFSLLSAKVFSQYLYPGKNYAKENKNTIGFSFTKIFCKEQGNGYTLLKDLITACSWRVDMKGELLYLAEISNCKINKPLCGLGMDLGFKFHLSENISAGINYNLSHESLTKALEGKNKFLSSPQFTSIAGIVYESETGLTGSFYYRFIDSRAGREKNPFIAKRYFLLDAGINYKFSIIMIGMSAENLLNAHWYQAELDTESLLKNESITNSEFQYNRGNPVSIKGMISIFF